MNIYSNSTSQAQNTTWKLTNLRAEMRNFIPFKLRIITQEEPLRKLQELFHSFEVQAQLHTFEAEGCTLKASPHNPDLQVPSDGSAWPLLE